MSSLASVSTELIESGKINRELFFYFLSFFLIVLTPPRPLFCFPEMYFLLHFLIRVFPALAPLTGQQNNWMCLFLKPEIVFMEMVSSGS